MYFKQERKGAYSATFFEAKDLPAIVRLVKVLEEQNKIQAQEAIKVADEIEFKE